jgi:hypothetical protein
LAGTTPGPDFFIVRPSGQSEGVVPSPNAGEKVDSLIPGKIGSPEFLDASFIYFSLGYLIISG